jgi:hypothetical protein
VLPTHPKIPVDTELILMLYKQQRIFRRFDAARPCVASCVALKAVLPLSELPFICPEQISQTEDLLVPGRSACSLARYW